MKSHLGIITAKNVEFTLDTHTNSYNTILKYTQENFKLF